MSVAKGDILRDVSLPAYGDVGNEFVDGSIDWGDWKVIGTMLDSCVLYTDENPTLGARLADSRLRASSIRCIVLGD